MPDRLLSETRGGGVILSEENLFSIKFPHSSYPLLSRIWRAFSLDLPPLHGFIFPLLSLMIGRPTNRAPWITLTIAKAKRKEPVFLYLKQALFYQYSSRDIQVAELWYRD